MLVQTSNTASATMSVEPRITKSIPIFLDTMNLELCVTGGRDLERAGGDDETGTSPNALFRLQLHLLGSNQDSPDPQAPVRTSNSGNSQPNREAVTSVAGVSRRECRR